MLIRKTRLYLHRRSLVNVVPTENVLELPEVLENLIEIEQSNCVQQGKFKINCSTNFKLVHIFVANTVGILLGYKENVNLN